MEIIDAGSAKLAGLQIDTLSKYRGGQLTLDHWYWFNNLTRSQRDMLSGADLKVLESKVSKNLLAPEKFALLVDLGIITVPKDYDHRTCLAVFMKKNRKKFYPCGVNDNITDANFPNPSRILKPGDKLWVRVFEQVISGTTTSEERMTFLATQKAIHTGSQGASLVFDQKRKELPKNYWYSSFDEKDRLWKDAVSNHRVPNVFVDSGGDFGFDLCSFEGDWGDDDAFLCFCDPE